MKRIRTIVIVVLLASLTMLGGWQVWERKTTSIYRSFHSPDGQFSLIVYKRTTSVAFPGQSGDSPGYIKLVDRQGKVLGKKKVEMVQLIEESVILWENNSVYIGPLDVEWKLPIARNTQ